MSSLQILLIATSLLSSTHALPQVIARAPNPGHVIEARAVYLPNVPRAADAAPTLTLDSLFIDRRDPQFSGISIQTQGPIQATITFEPAFPRDAAPEATVAAVVLPRQGTEEPLTITVPLTIDPPTATGLAGRQEACPVFDRPRGCPVTTTFTTTGFLTAEPATCGPNGSNGICIDARAVQVKTDEITVTARAI